MSTNAPHGVFLGLFAPRRRPLRLYLTLTCHLMDITRLCMDLTRAHVVPTLHLVVAFLHLCCCLLVFCCISIFFFVILFLLLVFVGYSLIVPIWIDRVVETRATRDHSFSLTTPDREINDSASPSTASSQWLL